MINNNRKGLEMKILNKVYVNDLNEVNNEYYGNVEDVISSKKINKDGYYKFNCLSDSIIEIDSIEYIGIDCYVEDKKLDLDNGDWLSDDECVYGVDGFEYINIVI
jgi:hypothetical protein